MPPVTPADGDKIAVWLVENVRDMALVDIAEIEKKITRDLDRLNAQFFRKLAAKIGSRSNLKEFSSGWQPLSERWKKRKQALYPGSKNLYYQASGKFKSTIATLNGNQALGNTYFERDYTTSFTLSDEVREVFIQHKNSTRIRTAYRSVTSGRFVSKSAAFTRETVIARLILHGAPNLEDIDDLETYLFGQGGEFDDPKLAFVFTNVHGDRRRPLIGRYLKWWTETRQQDIIKRYIT